MCRSAKLHYALSTINPQRRIIMSVQLLIRDGNPYWYLSPDIWVVPGSDPNGSPGNPIAGQPAYLWAHVANTGNIDANSVRVDFYWANPALQVLRSNSSLVGSAFADIIAGSSQDVLCLVAWMPTIINDGHECLVAVANHIADPLPDPLPDAFDPPTFPQVAQKNLTVLEASQYPMSRAITIGGWRRADKAVVVTAEVGGSLDEISLARLGIKGLRPSKENSIEVGLGHQPRCAGEKESLGPKELRLRIPRGTSVAVYASIRAKTLLRGEYQLVNIIERSGDLILGGLGFIVVPEGKEKES
jgi:hypothetical protein